MSAGPVDSIRGAGRGLAQNWCVVDRTPRPHHTLAAYVRRATTVARNTCCRAASSSPRVGRTRNASRLCTRRHQPLDVLTDGEVIIPTVTPSIFIQLQRAIPDSDAGSAVVCRRLLSLKMISVDLLQLSFRLYCSAHLCTYRPTTVWANKEGRKEGTYLVR